MRQRNRVTVDGRKRVRGAVPSTVWFPGGYLAVKHRHGKVIWWHVFEAVVDAAGRGRRGPHVTAARTLDDVPAAISDWENSSIEECA